MESYVNVDSLPEKYRNVFPKYRSFNRIQSEIYPSIFNSDNSIVVSAPTSSGKTVIFELAIIKCLMENDNTSDSNFKTCQIVMVAPMKAICNERYRDWTARFAYLHLRILLLTGTTDTRYAIDLNSYNIIITTPEKWDSMMRQWHLYKDAIQNIDLFMIDEVQLVGDKSRGPTLEAIVSRMKTVRLTANTLRIIAATATASNVDDLAQWLGLNGRVCEHFSFDENTRPVPLKMLIHGYPSNKAYFKFDINLNYKLINLIMEHSEGKPTLIFCCTRSGVEMAAKQLAKCITTGTSIEMKQYLIDISTKISHPQASQLIKHGIGVHHAGILEDELQIIEDAFRQERLPVLITTTTLAMGVNLPAHLVIIKGTKMYANGGFQSYTDCQIQQMIGRAGRPQYDTSAVAIIMTTNEDKQKYEQMVLRRSPLESGLHLHLIEHLNSEIALRSLTDLAMCMQWLTTTFLYVRAAKNPRHYGIALGLNQQQMVRKLMQLFQIDINKLTAAGMALLDENASLTPTFLGELMAKHYLKFETIKNLTQIRGNESVEELLHIVARSKEFDDLPLRVSEKRVLNALNATKGEAIRFPMTGKIKTKEMKVNCLIQAVLGCLPIADHGLVVESEKIIKTADSVARCMAEYLLKTYDKFTAAYSAHLLSKCMKAKLWENSIYVARQLPGVGTQRARILAGLGKNSFTTLAHAGPNALNLALKTNIGENLVRLSERIPQYEMNIRLKSNSQDNGTKMILLEIVIRLINRNNLFESVVDPNNQMVLLVGNLTTNQVLFQDKCSLHYMLDVPVYTREVVVDVIQGFEKVDIAGYFFSTSWVGFDANSKITLHFPSSPKSLHVQHKTKPKTTIKDYFRGDADKTKNSGLITDLNSTLTSSSTDAYEYPSSTKTSVSSKAQSPVVGANRRKMKICAMDIFNLPQQNFEQQRKPLSQIEHNSIVLPTVKTRQKKKFTTFDLIDIVPQKTQQCIDKGYKPNLARLTNSAKINIDKISGCDHNTNEPVIGLSSDTSCIGKFAAMKPPEQVVNKWAEYFQPEKCASKIDINATKIKPTFQKSVKKKAVDADVKSSAAATEIFSIFNDPVSTNVTQKEQKCNPLGNKVNVTFDTFKPLETPMETHTEQRVGPIFTPTSNIFDMVDLNTDSYLPSKTFGNTISYSALSTGTNRNYFSIFDATANKPTSKPSHLDHYQNTSIFEETKVLTPEKVEEAAPKSTANKLPTVPESFITFFNNKNVLQENNCKSTVPGISGLPQDTQSTKYSSKFTPVSRINSSHNHHGYQKSSLKLFNKNKELPCSNHNIISSFRKTKSGRWSSFNKSSRPPSPSEYSYQKKPKMSHRKSSMPHAYTVESITTSNTVSLVCDSITKTKKSIVWGSPLVSERVLSEDNESELSFPDI